MSIVSQNHAGRALAIISFDDGALNVHATAFPIMQRYKLRGTCYVIPDRVGTDGFMTVPQLQELYTAGWDIAGHGKNHGYYGGAGSAWCQNDAAYVKTWLEGNGMPRGAAHLAYPHGSYDADAEVGIAAAGIATARTAELAALGAPPADNLAIGTRYLLDSESYATDFHNYVAAVTAVNAWTFCLHQVRDSGETGGEAMAAAHFEYLCQQFYGADLECCTISEWYANQSGPVALPDDLTKGASYGHPDGYYIPTKYGSQWAKGPYTYLV